MPKEPSRPSSDGDDVGLKMSQGKAMPKPQADYAAPAADADREDRYLIDLPRPTRDQQEFLGDLQGAASNYDPQVLVCGKKQGQ